MTKFFLPKQKGQKEHVDKHNKTKITPNCNESLSKEIAAMLKKSLTRQIQKTIRKISETSEPKERQKYETRLGELKSITKTDCRVLAFHILSAELNVDEENVQKLCTKVLGEQGLNLGEAVKNFYELLKKRESFKTAIQDFQRVRNMVNEKKHIKKQKSKLKKKAKLEMRKHKGPQTTPDEQENLIQGLQSHNQTSSHENLAQGSPVGTPPFITKKKLIQKVNPFEKKERTEFKKTGRNKVLQQKREKRYGNTQDQKPKGSVAEEPRKPSTKFQRLNKGQILHPSWQAKREIKSQMFIQPFEGKKILL